MSLIDFIWGFIQKQRWVFASIMILSLLWTFEMLFWPYFLRKMVDVLTVYDTDRLSAWPHIKTLFGWGAISFIFMECGFRLRDFLQARALPKLEANIRMTMFDHIQNHSPKYFNEHFSGSLANKIGDMVSTVSIILRNIIMLFVPACFSCMLTLVIFSQMSPSLALIVGCWIIIHLYIQDSLEKLMANRTTIVIAHRLSTLSKMDRILVFDHGKIIEEGTHLELLSQDGHYAHMWKMQAGGFLPESPIS